MFSRWLRLNHRVRLSALLTFTVSLSLAGVFFVVLRVVRGQALDRRFLELEAGVKRISVEWNTPDGLSEVEENFPGVDIAAYDADGRLLASTSKRPLRLVTGRRKHGDLLTYGMRVGANTYVASASWGETKAGLRQLELVLAGLWLPLTLLAAAVSWYGGGLVLKPVRELLESAERLSSDIDGALLTTTDRAEFEALADSLNLLITRVRHSASLQEQFASDAAHELRTPLALLRTRIETNLQRSRTPEEHVASQTAMLRQIERLTSIVESLLYSARRADGAVEAVRFDAAVVKAAKDWAELREWPGERLVVETQECFAWVTFEEVAIIVRNLLDNGARHSPLDTPLEVCVTVSDRFVRLTVHDFGPGISGEETALVFERFYRSDEARSRQDGGAGIGLAVVKRIVESRGGRIAFAPTPVGALVEVVLPGS